MSATQTRWLCRGCAREWAYVHNWDISQGCPVCHSFDVDRRSYQPAFPGGDLPREDAPILTEPTERAVDERDLYTRNDTLALSSPEFA